MYLFSVIAVIAFTCGCGWYAYEVFAARKTHAIPFAHVAGGTFATLFAIAGMVWIMLAGC